MFLSIPSIAIILCVSLSVVTTSSSKEVDIYKSVDENGHITYTDQPSANSDKVSLTKKNSVKIISASKRTLPPKLPVTSPLIILTITSPENHETIRDNQGNIQINATASQRIPTSYRYQLMIDGDIHSIQSITPAFSVKNIDRGAHKIKITLVDDKGKIIALSATYTIYMHRASIN